MSSSSFVHWSWISSNRRASLLPIDETRMNAPTNLVVIFWEVGREVCVFSSPVSLDVAAAR